LCTQEEHDTACLRRFPFDEITLLKIGSPGAGEIRDGALAARRLLRARSPISMARKKSARLHLAGAQSYRARTEDLRRAA
jgi:hypothetical protein